MSTTLQIWLIFSLKTSIVHMIGSESWKYVSSLRSSMSSHFYKPLGDSGPQVTFEFNCDSCNKWLTTLLTLFVNRDNVGFRFYSTVWRWASSDLYKCYCRTASVAPETGIKRIETIRVNGVLYLYIRVITRQNHDFSWNWILLVSSWFKEKPNLFGVLF